MSETLSQLSSLFTLLFAVSSMLSVGLSMSLRQIVEPLRNVRLVILALAANFVIMPLAAVLLSRVLSLAPDHNSDALLRGQLNAVDEVLNRPTTHCGSASAAACGRRRRTDASRRRGRSGRRTGVVHRPGRR